MVLAMAGFTFNDAIIKWISTSLPLFEVIFLRGLIATTLIGVMAYYAGVLRFQRSVTHPTLWLRGVMEVGATFTFLMGLKHMPIGNAIAILSSLPLAVTLGAAIFLSEPVGWRRWTAILTGFVGVLIIVRPGFEGFSNASLYIVVCVFFVAARDLITRSTPKNVASLTLTLMSSVFITVSAGLVAVLTGALEPVPMPILSLLVASACIFIVGYYFIIAAARIGDIAAIAPFRYTGLVWALLVGVIFFNDPIDWITILGSAIVVGSGLYTLYREQQHKQMTS